jgi:hypothetical protein
MTLIDVSDTISFYYLLTIDDALSCHCVSFLFVSLGMSGVLQRILNSCNFVLVLFKLYLFLSFCIITFVFDVNAHAKV